MAKLSWFPFEVNAFLSSSKVAVMTTEEIGAYTLLLCHAWNDPRCSLPDDDEILRKLGRLSGDITRVRACFVKRFKRLINQKLLDVWMEQQVKHDLKVKAGVKGNEVRWGSHSDEDATRKPVAKRRYSESESESEEEVKIKSKSGADDVLRQDFEAWWEAMPSRGNKKLYKQKAWEFYVKVVIPEERSLALASAKAYARHCQQEDRLPVDPHRFLNGQKGQVWREFIPMKPVTLKTPSVPIQPTGPFISPPQELMDRLKKLGVNITTPTVPSVKGTPV